MEDELFERRLSKNYLQRAADLTILLLLASLLSYRLVCLSSSHGGGGWDLTAWQLAIGCEAWFTLVWLLVLNIK